MRIFLKFIEKEFDKIFGLLFASDNRVYLCLNVSAHHVNRRCARAQPYSVSSRSFNYFRFFKTDAVDSKPGVFAAIKVPVIVSPSSAGGEGGAALVTSIQINGNGDVQEGYIKLDSSSGEYTWSDTEPSE